MDSSFASLELGGEELHDGIETTVEELPDEILTKSLLGMEPPFSHRRISKQLRGLFDEGCTKFRIQDQGCLQSDPPTAHGGPGLNKNSSDTVFQHGDLLSLLRRLPRLDTLLDQDHCRSQALPWAEMGQILGGQLTCLVSRCDRHLGFLELFPSLRRLEVRRSSCVTFQHTIELQPLSELCALQHLGLRFLPVRDLGPLGSCSQLQFLELHFCPIGDLGPLAHFKKLCTLRLLHLDTMRDLGPLSACVSLQRLDLYGCSRITSLTSLELCTNLLCLDLFTPRVSDFSALSLCTGLQHLCLFGCGHLPSLTVLASCRKLQHLVIRMKTLPSLEPLWGLQELHHLYLLGTQSGGLCPGPPGLGPLTRVKHLHLNADQLARLP